MSTFCETNSLEELVCALRCSGRSLQLQWNLYVLARSKCGYELKALKDKPDFFAAELCSLVLAHGGQIVTVENHRTAGGCIKTGEKTEQRRLSASRRSDDCDERSLWNSERHISQNGDLLIAAPVFPCNFIRNEHYLEIVFCVGRNRMRE
jgi:hypothetical protein